MTIIPYEENDIELNLDLLALDLTNDPNPVRFDGVPPKPEPEKAVIALFGSLPGLLVQDAFAQTGSEKTYFFINDHLGTPQKVIDETGAVVWSADYKPFGQAGITVNTLENNFRFPGQYYDEETALHYNWHRYYDPGTGRYLTPDPIGLAGGINLFSYASNSPIIHVDPRGLRKMIPWVPIYKIGCVTVAATRLVYCINKKCKKQYGKCEKGKLRECIDDCYDAFECTVEVICRVKMIEPKPAHPAVPELPGSGSGGVGGGF